MKLRISKEARERFYSIGTLMHNKKICSSKTRNNKNA